MTNHGNNSKSGDTSFKGRVLLTAAQQDSIHKTYDTCPGGVLTFSASHANWILVEMAHPLCEKTTVLFMGVLLV